MSGADWCVLVFTLLGIICYGIYRSRGSRNIDGYLLGDKSLPWYHVCFSVMATQASAITFLSAPGLAYTSGMGFAQFYFGLPLAMIVLSITFVPMFHRLRVFTAYEFLEKRFDLKTRAITAILFLIQRGVSTGITIYAPAVILSSILHLDIQYTTVAIGVLVICYTMYGGTKAVSHTQLLQMSIIFIGLLLAGVTVVYLLPKDVGLIKAIHIAGKSGKAKAIDFSFDWNNQYTVWSGLIGGLFLQLSYFGTDQSQVGRYLTGSSIRDSRLGLLMNGLLKVPMQFFILLIGLLVFVYYQYHAPPLFFNGQALEELERGPYREELLSLHSEHEALFAEKEKVVSELSVALDRNDEEAINVARERLHEFGDKNGEIQEQLHQLMKVGNARADTNDNNYIFLHFVTQKMPKGLVGLLIAIVFLASMGATASGLNALASTSVVDIYKRLVSRKVNDRLDLSLSRWMTLGWGLFCIGVALFAQRLGNLLEAVNILGSLFYGTILGIFMVAFYLKKVGGSATFVAAIISELIVVICWKYEIMTFLWLNLLGCLSVMCLATILQALQAKKIQ
ncbi:sodium:solute symporter [Olivibacter sitiensis]|uniref:sodium:solute symporter n=1 Tax=Olivibacter sitiensis TaxID=376470 RepID=UPI000415C676|nr:sodium:solute symporter [Olivibacter sitiensis]